MTFPNFALHATPVNRVASRLSFGESQAWEPKRGITCHETYDFPPLPLRAPPSGHIKAQDYAGVRRGYMTALRYHDSNGRGAKWLCRCDCGKYETRLAKKWVKSLSQPDSCSVCQKTHWLQRRGSGA